MIISKSFAANKSTWSQNYLPTNLILLLLLLLLLSSSSSFCFNWKKGKKKKKTNHLIIIIIIIIISSLAKLCFNMMPMTNYPHHKQRFFLVSTWAHKEWALGGGRVPNERILSHPKDPLSPHPPFSGTKLLYYKSLGSVQLTIITWPLWNCVSRY